MAKRQSKRQARSTRGFDYFPIKVPINTLSGGVGRQAPAKRLPTEVQDMDNMFCTTERSIDKRNGFIQMKDPAGGYSALGLLNIGTSPDLWYSWFVAGTEQKYLIIIDYAARVEGKSSSQLFWVFKVNPKTEKFDPQEVDENVPDEIREYITWSTTEGGEAKEVLKSVSVGSSLLVLNTEVKAGFTSSGIKYNPDNDQEMPDDTEVYNNLTYGLDGNLTGTDDLAGKKIEYQTSITVDKEHKAEVWTEFSNYTYGSEAIDITVTEFQAPHRYGVFIVPGGVAAVDLPGPTNNATETPAINISNNGVGVAAKGIDILQVDDGGSDAIAFEVELDSISIKVPTAAGGTGVLYYIRGIAGNASELPGQEDTDSNEMIVATDLSSLEAVRDAYIDAINGDSNAAVRRGAALLQGITGITASVGSDDSGATTDSQITITADNTGYAGNAIAIDNDDIGFAIKVADAEMSGGSGPQWAIRNDDDETGLVPDGGGFEDGLDFTDYIPVEDYVYPNLSTPHLGQSITKFSDLKFPPDENDLTAHNGNSYVTEAIKALYPDSGNVDGKGKIYFLSQAYLSSAPGYYRVIRTTTTPYLEKIRTPDEMSLLDKKRMPMMLYLDTEDNMWKFRMIDWDPRASGNTISNPGPSPFKDKEKNIQHKKIKAMAYYRDRLFLATDDILFSSKLGDFSNFFIDDPSNITFRDPIDLRVSSNKYTPITYLTPYRESLFLATAGDTQFELLGSENQISPLSAEVSPTSFFPMTKDIEPILMSSSLFFYANQRLYIYFGRNQQSPQQAAELSTHVPEYLPKRYWDVTTSAPHNMIFVVEADEETGTVPTNKIFCYRNQIRGDQMVQNSFFTFSIKEEFKIQSIKAIDNDLFIAISTDTGDIYLERMSLLPEEGSVPRIDNRMEKIFLYPSTYNSATNQTEFNLTFETSVIDVIIASGEEWGGAVLDVVSSSINKKTGYTILHVSGNFAGVENGFCGTRFTAKADLSPIYVRDDQNNVVPGALSLRYGVIRHHKTGLYNVEVTRKLRATKSFLFTHNTVHSRESTLDSDFFEENGTFKFPVMGFADDIVITLTSDYPNPMNLTNIELTGKFKHMPRYLAT
jgi:hypothetical protein